MTLVTRTIFLLVAALLIPGCVGSGEPRKDHYLVEVTTTYQARGMSGEPSEGTSCSACEIRFSIWPSESEKTPATATEATQKDGNASVRDDAFSISPTACTKPAGQYWVTFPRGGIVRQWCEYRGEFDTEGRFTFWVPKSSPAAVEITDVTGSVTNQVPECRQARYTIVRAIEMEVGADAATNVPFTLGCFRGD